MDKQKSSNLVGIIPAAGKATRFNGVNKTLLKINGETLINRNIGIMSALGIKKIYIIVRDNKIPKHLGKKKGIKYIYQKEGDLREAILLAKPYVKSRAFVMLGDCYFAELPCNLIDDSENAVFLKQCNSQKEIAKSYGVYKDKRVEIIEKPKVKVLPWLGLGMYIMNKDFFAVLSRHKINFMEAFNFVNCSIKSCDCKYANFNTKEEYEKAI